MNGVSAVMARIGQIQTLAQKAGVGFGATLEGAIGATAVSPSAFTDESQPDTRVRGTSSTAPPSQPGALPAALPAGAARWQPAIERAASANGIDPKLLTALVWVESSFNPSAVSYAGAIGLAQLMPDTANQLRVDPYDPEQNLDGGARFLSAMFDRFGRTDLALAAYNAGPARVASLHDGGPGVPIAEDYVTAVLDKYRQLGGTE